MTIQVKQKRLCAGWSVFLAALFLGGGWELVAADDSPRRAEEYDVKTAFLFNVLKFVEWPEKKEQENMVITVVNHSAFAVKISDLEGKLVRGKKIRVEQTDSLPATLTSRVLIVSKLPSPEFGRLISIANENHILVLSDHDDFAARGGMIGISLEDRRIRVDINLDAMNSADLTVNSKLLRIARIVNPGGDSEAEEGSR